MKCSEKTPACGATVDAFAVDVIGWPVHAGASSPAVGWTSGGSAMSA